MALLAGLGLLPGCGARSSLDSTIASGGRPAFDEPAGGAGAPAAECAVDVDCASDPPDRCQPVACQEGTCVDLTPVVCNDQDPCTDDVCTPATGLCVFAPVSFDLDLDGVRGPRPGTKAGDPGSCGDDCDDTSPLAFPGAKELCDGVDNDCNGVIDDSAKYLPVSTDPVLVSDASLDKAYAGGMAYAGDTSGYLAAYAGQQDSDTSIYVRPVEASGQPGPIGPKVNGSTGDAQGGPMVWTGDRYGMAWSDRRNGDYEIYANTFGPDGAKLGPDVRVSDQPGFSVNPALAWTGTRFFVAWQDDAADVFQVHGRVLGLDGQPQSELLVLADAEGFNVNAESPAVAATSVGLGVVFRRVNRS
ncbi:MAG: hypothetical protein EOO75_11465 [Myxococcales bacterium]|nr:MAG: hypothetical protein EOO75_11465 [Myxococcales bacterium]